MGRRYAPPNPNQETQMTTRKHASKTSKTTATLNTASGAAHYARYRPLAMALSASDIRPFRADVSLATANATRGIDIVLGHASELTAALPKLNLGAVKTLGDMGSALAYAAAQVERFSPTPTNIKPLLVQARHLRGLLLAAADMLVLRGAVPAGVVAEIRKGRGPIDTAGDCVALAALFTKSGAATTGKVAVTAADIANADEIGSRLLRLLRPSSAKKPLDKDLVAATDVRDRLWTLFERTWQDNVWRAGAWLYGRDVEQYVPPLHSHVGRRRPRGSTPPAPTPAPAPTPSS
jgi:hypothetical protein